MKSNIPTCREHKIAFSNVAANVVGFISVFEGDFRQMVLGLLFRVPYYLALLEESPVYLVAWMHFLSEWIGVAHLGLHVRDLLLLVVGPLWVFGCCDLLSVPLLLGDFGEGSALTRLLWIRVEEVSDHVWCFENVLGLLNIGVIKHADVGSLEALVAL